MNAEYLSLPLDSIIACHECDLLHPVKPLPPRGSARCSRCGGLLYRRKDDSINRAIAFALAGLVLYLLANIFPFLYFKVQGTTEVNTMITGVLAIGGYGMWPLAAVVFLSSILAPGLKILFMLYVLLPLRFNRRAPGARRAFRWLEAVGPWGMLEVYMLGLLVAVVNLTSMASIEMGSAFFTFIALMLATTAASACLDSREVWEKLDGKR